MSAGPIRGLRFIHQALRAAGSDIARRSAACNDPEAVKGLAEAVNGYTAAARGHAQGEDDGYFPTLTERAPGVAESFVFDHREEQQHLDDMDRLVADCPADQLEAFKQLCTVVCAQMELHMRKEEELLWPLTEEKFSPPEQGAIMQAILGAIPKAQFPSLLPWLVNNLELDEAVDYLQLLQRLQPPEVFQTTLGWMRDSVRTDHWSAIDTKLNS
jgi:iron-sulfur cluster repair protein YtfE (RIC family)